ISRRWNPVCPTLDLSICPALFQPSLELHTPRREPCCELRLVGGGSERFPSVVHITVTRDENDLDSWTKCVQFAREHAPALTWHADICQQQVNLAFISAVVIKRLLRILGFEDLIACRGQDLSSNIPDKLLIFD